jgi:hypothetical protein
MNYARLSTLMENITFMHLVVILKQPNNVYLRFNRLFHKNFFQYISLVPKMKYKKKKKNEIWNENKKY